MGVIGMIRYKEALNATLARIICSVLHPSIESNIPVYNKHKLSQPLNANPPNLQHVSLVRLVVALTLLPRPLTDVVEQLLLQLQLRRLLRLLLLLFLRRMLGPLPSSSDGEEVSWTSLSLTSHLSSTKSATARCLTHETQHDLKDKATRS